MERALKERRLSSKYTRTAFPLAHSRTLSGAGLESGARVATNRPGAADG